MTILTVNPSRDHEAAGQLRASRLAAVVAPAREATRVVAPGFRADQDRTYVGPRVRRGARTCAQSHEPDVRGGRLTARGRIAVALVWLAMIAAAALMLAGPWGSPAGAVETTKVMVQPGDTLWQLADTAAPGANMQDTVAEIIRLNGLDSAGDIRPGDVLLVPIQP